MAKHVRTWNEAKYQRYLKEGRGQGDLSQYVPWVQIQDFPSKGIVSRVKGNTTGRVHHLMSNLELYYFLILDWSDKTIDIREQYPLSDLADAISIADAMEIRYPYDNSSGFPYVLTTDFLITTKSGMMARAIKPSSELKKKRVREKLEIERRYWDKRNIDWKLVTEFEIPRTKARNIEWLLTGKAAHEMIPDDDILNQAERAFCELYENSSRSISMIIDMIEKDFQLEPGSGMSLYKKLVIDKKIRLDMNQEINLTVVRNEAHAEYDMHQ